MKVSILYSELADYSVACLRSLQKGGVEVQLIHWPINPEAPFQFDLSFTAETYDRTKLDRQTMLEVVSRFKPDIILCSGWMDRDYLFICRQLKSKCRTVPALDNHWIGSMKQRAAAVLSPLTLKPIFSHAFVPGEMQKQFAMRLGFKTENIRLGFYSADVDRFDKYFQSRKPLLTKEPPKKFLYLGRYVRHKGIFDLWEAFKKFRVENQEWELWCAGTGDQFNDRDQSEGIRHFGFVQPGEMQALLNETSVYILPSHFEPWGVSVHEMAVAGFPIIASDAVGAASRFVVPGENGVQFAAKSVRKLHETMSWMASRSADELLKMSLRSHDVGTSYTPDLWVDQLMSIG